METEWEPLRKPPRQANSAQAGLSDAMWLLMRMDEEDEREAAEVIARRGHLGGVPVCYRRGGYVRRRAASGWMPSYYAALEHENP